MHKDQLYGGIIFIVAIVLIIIYNLWIFNLLPVNQIYALLIPVWLLVMLVLGIAGWIGWTMASTPPPKPIEELTAPMSTDTGTTTSASKSDDKPSDTKKS